MPSTVTISAPKCIVFRSPSSTPSLVPTLVPYETQAEYHIWYHAQALVMPLQRFHKMPPAIPSYGRSERSSDGPSDWLSSDPIMSPSTVKISASSFIPPRFP